MSNRTPPEPSPDALPAALPAAPPAAPPAGQTTARRKTNIRSLTLEDISEWTAIRGFEGYRASQIAGWLYNRPPVGLDEMTNLPAALREALDEDFDAAPPREQQRSDSVDKTVKLLVGLHDGKVVESVVIPREDRRTLCISSQVGCALDCGFCATARLGLDRNLEPGEIIGQVLLGRQAAQPYPLTNYVFMGMGEPLANYDRLLRALEIMTARWGLGISPRRITVSTAGLVPQLERLARDTSVHLAVSLGSPRDEVRDVLMPINKRYPLVRLMDACRNLDLPRRKRITFEYTMLDGVNDTDQDISGLIELFHGVPVKLNLIPFNEFPEAGYRGSPEARIRRFQDRLLRAGVHTTIRASRGSDIAAACGQLASSAA